MVRFAPSSAAILRAIFRTSLSEKPIARSAFRSWQMPKKSTFGFIAISPMHKAGTVFHSGIRFPRFLTFVLLALFVATSQANGRFQTAAAGAAHGLCTPPRISPSCPHYVPLWLDRCTIIGWQGLRKTACHGCFRLDGSARHLIGPSLCRSIAPAQVVFAHPPNRFPSSGSAN